MITYDMTENAKDCIISKWGNINGKKVIDECSKVAPFNGNSGKFLDHCTACGGNWTGMLLSGIRALYPNVWEAIPNKMGASPWESICSVLVLCGVDTNE